MVGGGAMLAGHHEGRTLDLNSVFEAVGQHQAGKLDDEGLEAIECNACPTCGSCSGMFTANSMNCLAEVIGMALPGNGTIPAVYSERIRFAKDSGEQVMRVLAADRKPRDILTEAAVGNALAADASLGCSTNTVLHLAAIATEAGLDFDLRRINEVAAKVPHICKIAPAGTHHMEDLYHAGGIQAVMNRLIAAGLMDGSALSVAGGTVGEAVASARVLDDTVIRPVDDPWHATGGLAVLFGNLAPGRRRGQGGRRRRRDAACTAARRACSRARPTPWRRSPRATSPTAPSSSSAARAPRARPACPRCSAPPPCSPARAGTRTWRSSPTAASAAPRAAPPSATSRPRRTPAAPSPPCATATPSASTSLHARSRSSSPEEEIARRLADWRPAPRDGVTGYLARYVKLVSGAEKGAVLQ